MTANRDLKRRVRDRQAKTGESYRTALHHVLAQRPGGIPSAIPTVEFVDVTEVAAALGLKCRAAMSPALAHTIDVEQTLARFREALAATGRDPALALMRTVALDGEHVPLSLASATFQEIQEAVRFVERVRAGLGGISGNGRMLALRAVPRAARLADPPAGERSQPAAPSERIALFELQLTPSFAAVRPPLLVINSLDEVFPDAFLNRFRQEMP